MVRAKKHTTTACYRLSLVAKHKLGELTKWETRASDNNTIVWLIEKEYREQKRRRLNDTKY